MIRITITGTHALTPALSAHHQNPPGATRGGFFRDDGSKEPLALIETAIDRGQECKTATLTGR